MVRPGPAGRGPVRRGTRPQLFSFARAVPHGDAGGEEWQVGGDH